MKRLALSHKSNAMNAVEHIVEFYYRLCHNCFTYSDVKVDAGNNRQIDILAVSLTKNEQYHIECSVTHCLQWCPTPKKLIAEFQRKFSGHPKKREGKNTDYAKGKRYGGAITGTYRRLGIKLGSVKRVWVCWSIKDPETLKQELGDYYFRTGNLVEVIEMRDTVMPALLKAVSSANYDDEILRVFSLIKQAEMQTRKRLEKV